ncbi:hypothetical protein I547_3667 [Mycobacterium kansasii 824]|nr:hypothetical protein I547_3667 [Mycobacterium kansasii 824]
MAQLTAPFSRLTGLPGAAGGLSQLTNTAGQQAQMISSLTQQGARPQAPRPIRSPGTAIPPAPPRAHPAHGAFQ